MKKENFYHLIIAFTIVTLLSSCVTLPFNLDGALDKAAKLAAQEQAKGAWKNTTEILTGSSEKQIKAQKQRQELAEQVIKSKLELMQNFTNSSTQSIEILNTSLASLDSTYDKYLDNETVIQNRLIIMGISILGLFFLLGRAVNNWRKNRRLRNVPTNS